MDAFEAKFDPNQGHIAGLCDIWTVPHYFLHIHDDQGEALDLQGVDLPDLNAARVEAVSSIRGWLADDAQRRRSSMGGHVEVVEGYAMTAAIIVPFTEAVRHPA